MTGFRAILISLVATAVLAQEELPDQIFRATVDVVVAPVTVTDRNGNYVHGLQPHQFRLYDNGKLQDIQVDEAFVPISLVVAVQADWASQEVLPKIQKIGPLLQGMVVGERGEVAVLAFDHRIQVMQDFTSDPQLIDKAFERMRAGSSSRRLIDATTHAIRMLARRPDHHRRVVLLISETRDIASEGRTREALTYAQLENVVVYTAKIPQLVTAFTSKPMPPRPDPIPPTARPTPAGVPPSPASAAQTTGGQGTSANFIPLFVEIFRQAKSIFVDNPSEIFTQYTGGREYSFATQRGLESAISRIGEELHSQYLISYTPNNKLEGGFHEIEVQVIGRPDVTVTTRPGYWMAAVPD